MAYKNYSDNIVDLVTTINKGDIEFGTPLLGEKFNLDDFYNEVNEGNINRTSPVDGLVNYKYSPMTAALRKWNDNTVRARGLVVDDNERIVARGFNKFFNLSEVESFGVDVDINEQGVIMDKLDGSLGLAYKVGDSWRVSTAGSLVSDQALHATRIMNERYADTPYTPGKTMLVEIIYPENRIVTNYGDADDLFLIGGADTNGYWISPDDFDFAGPKVEHYRGTINDVLNTADPEDGTEGFVIRLDSGLMVKVKHPKYLQLHRAKSLFSEKRVWESLKDGSFSEMLAILPDEFHDEAKSMKKNLESQFNAVVDEVDDLVSQVPEGERRDRAIWVNENVKNADTRSLVMMKAVAGNDITPKVWDRIKPVGSSTNAEGEE